MIIKMNNKDEKFYCYMGKMFGSRIIQKQVNDRIYDDNDKEWYLYIEEERVAAFVSISKSTIKNVYSIKEEYLLEILQKIKSENKITESIVTNIYVDIYQKAGFKISKDSNYKNFVVIYDK